jgi:protein SCO1/2
MEDVTAYWELKTALMYRIVFLRISIFIIIFSFLACTDVKKTPNLPYYNQANFTPLFLANNDASEKEITHQIADFSLTNQSSQIITQKNIEDKIHVANFIFTSCGSICPVMTKNMKMVENAYQNNDDVVILSYSVTPWIDDVKRLKAYTQLNKINASNWHFLTGSKSEIYNLARQSYFAEEDLGFTKDSTDFLHTEHVLLVDKTKRIRGIYNGTLQLEMEQLIKDIANLKEEGN